MQYRQLGASGMNVSVIAFGAWQIGDPQYWGPDDKADAEAAVQAALDAGINLFDTAELYGDGESERELGKALGARRKDVFVATKVVWQHCPPAELRLACENSLRRLGTDYLDLYQVHWPSRETPFAETYGELLRLREEGKIRAIGVSNFGRLDLEDWFRTGAAVSNQLGYNPIFRAVEYEILPACRRHGLGVLTYMPLMQGVLSGRWKTIEEIPPKRRRSRHYAGTREGARHGEAGCEELLMDTLASLRTCADDLGVPMAEMSLAWLVAQPDVTSVVIGARNPAQLRDNARAGDLRIDASMLARLNAITEPIKQRLGANADLWLGAAESRIR